MRNRYLLFAVLVFSLTALVCWGTQYQKNIVRKDLLNKKIMKLEPPERNIFKPDKRRKSSASLLSGDIKPIQGIPEAGPLLEEAGKDAVVSASLRLRYIGYVGSREKTVALVIINDQALAVKKGEMVLDKIKILNISRNEIEFSGPDSITSKVSLEGEER